MIHFRSYWLACLLVVSCGGRTNAQVDETAVALMRGVENARVATPPSEMTFKIRFDDVNTGPVQYHSEYRGSVRFDAASGRYRMVAKRGGAPSVSIYDGEQLLSYDGDVSAVVCGPDQAPSDLSFDPRVIGISPLYRPTHSLRGLIAYRDAKSLRVAGTRQLEGVVTHVIEIVDTFKQRLSFWVQPDLGYRVVRYDVQIDLEDGSKLTYECKSHFAPEDDGWIPARVETRYFRDGKLTGKVLLDEIKVKPFPELVNASWSFDELMLPVGQPIADLRTMQRIGYWNGLFVAQ